MSPRLETLPVIVIYPYTRCNCRCAMCDIWKRTETAAISDETYQGYLRDFDALRVQWAVFSGGEPLMHPRLHHLCRMTAERGIRTTILTSGLLLERHAAWIADTVNDVIVSLDGPAEVHDRIRGVPGAFAALARGVRALRQCRPGYAVSARCTVSRANHDALRRTAIAAKSLGLDSVSFLAADLTSSAFDHAAGWDPTGIGLPLDEVCVLAEEIEALVNHWHGTDFIRESPEKLRRIVNHFRASLALEEPVAPVCNAPWVSAVIETDGTVRPCFFHPPVGRTGTAGLIPVLNGAAAVDFRSRLEVPQNDICRRCVCSLRHAAP
jgi:MoaA/NifB/PqqE/SkfB family radical SAM enzyme